MATPLDVRILTVLGTSDGMTRAALTAALGASPNAVAAAVAELLDSAAIVSEVAGRAAPVMGAEPSPARRRGRPTSVLRIAGPMSVIAVVTVSVAGPRVAVVTPGGRVLGHVVLPTVDETSPDAVTDLVRAAVRAAADSSGFTVGHVVLSVPAPFEGVPGLPAASVRPPRRSAGSPGYDSLVDGGLSPSLALDMGVPVTADNDANLAALGEAAAGAGRDHSDLVHLALDGYSVGAGLLLGGRLHRGASGFGGELAHVHIDDDGPLCACGARGCLSTRLGRPLLDAIERAWGASASWADVLDRAAAGESRAQRVLADLGRLIGRPLADLVTVLNPSLLIVDSRLGGGGPWVAGGIREQVDRFAVPGAARALAIVTGELDDAVAVGAARLVRDTRLSAVTGRSAGASAG